MFGWDDMEKHMRRGRQSAQASQPGLPREHLVPGAVISISPNLSTGDRSYSHDIYEVVGRNEGHVLVSQRSGHVSSYFKGPHLLSIHEHEFYGADHLLPHAEPASGAKPGEIAQ